ncbi:methionyl-tRNA formyltransferase [bacterium]|nr:methionyl-tRNA formyltransferase [bacterium]
MAALRVVFMGTPDFSVPALDALCGDSRFEVVGVYTQPDRPTGRGLQTIPSPVKKAALEKGLPVFQPEKLTLPGEFEKLAALNPDQIVVVAFGQILKKNVLELPKKGCVNIHASLLPRWRGAAPIQRSILEGDAETGVTTMLMAEKLDAGDILMKGTTPIGLEDTAQTLHDRLSKLGAELILPTLKGLADGTLKSQKQNEAQVTYAEKLGKDMEGLDPALTATVLDRRIRALNPWPGTSVWVAGSGGATQRLKVKQARVHAGLKGASGQIFERSGMVLMATAQGCLELQRVQWDGRKEVDAAGFLNGLRGSGQQLPLEIRSKP